MFFHKNKIFKSSLCRRIFAAVFLLSIISIPIIVSITKAQTVPVELVEIFSNYSSYENEDPGAWKITKSAKWLEPGRARITFEANSIPRYDDKKLDVLMVIDNSGSMAGDKLLQVKADSTDLVDYLLTDPENRVALVTFESEAVVVSGFTNDKDLMIDHIDQMIDIASTNYNQALIKAGEVLDGYTEQDDRNLVLLFLTDGFPNDETPNEVGQYQILKAMYPYMTINGIQYEMGNVVFQPIINVTDNQFIADMSSLNNVLFDAAITPYTYSEFIVTDFIDNDYWNIGSVDDISASMGEVSLDYDGSTPRISWDMSGSYLSGTTQTLAIDITLNDTYSNYSSFDLLFPTNKHETITSKMQDVPDEEIESDLTPILKNTRNVLYEINSPSGCEIQGVPPSTTAYPVMAVVQKNPDNKLTCGEYTLKKWEIITDGVDMINDDYFRMPDKDVTLKAIWTKLGISKSVGGISHIRSRTTFDTGTNVKDKMLALRPSTSDQIKAMRRADELPDGFDTSDTAHILSVPGDLIPIYAWYDSNVIYYYTEAEDIFTNVDASNMFYYFYYLEEIDGIEEWITSETVNMYRMFYNTGYYVNTSFVLDLSHWDVSNVENMGEMFGYAGYNAKTWSIGDLSKWDVRKVVNVVSMFDHAAYSAKDLDFVATDWHLASATSLYKMFNYMGRYATGSFSLNLANWKMENATAMNDLFNYAAYTTSSATINVTGWDVRNVQNMSRTFNYFGNYAQTVSIIGLSSWDVRSVITTSYMFSYVGMSGALSIDLDLSGWGTSNLTDTSWMFGSMGDYASKSIKLNLSGWDMSNVTSSGSMFGFGSGSDFESYDLNLSGWKISSKMNVKRMFEYSGKNAKESWKIDVSNWDLTDVTDLSYMFSYIGINTKKLSIIGLSTWDVSRVTNMSYMFYDTGYGATDGITMDIAHWNASSATDMSYMFYYMGFNMTSGFELDVSDWDTSNVQNMSYMFYDVGYKSTSWTIKGLENFDVGSVTDMSNMLQYTGYYATDVDLDLSGWDTSNVINMGGVFSSVGYYANNFNLDISGWNTSKVTNMNSLFYYAGYSAPNWSITIPATNGNGVANTTNMIYGSSTSTGYSSGAIAGNSGRTFTLATE